MTTPSTEGVCLTDRPGLINFSTTFMIFQILVDGRAQELMPVKLEQV
jgi:hypothetical protein